MDLEQHERKYYVLWYNIYVLCTNAIRNDMFIKKIFLYILVMFGYNQIETYNKPFILEDKPDEYYDNFNINNK